MGGAGRLLVPVFLESVLCSGAVVYPCNVNEIVAVSNVIVSD